MESQIAQFIIKGMNPHCVPPGCYFMRQTEAHLPPLPSMQLWAPAADAEPAVVLASCLAGPIQHTNPTQN